MQTYLVHHGILGQKWGVRRYQNPDGTWTDAGKKRYGNNTESKNKTTLKNASRKADYKSGQKAVYDYEDKLETKKMLLNDKAAQERYANNHGRKELNKALNFNTTNTDNIKNEMNNATKDSLRKLESLKYGSKEWFEERDKYFEILDSYGEKYTKAMMDDMNISLSGDDLKQLSKWAGVGEGYANSNSDYRSIYNPISKDRDYDLEDLYDKAYNPEKYKNNSNSNKQISQKTQTEINKYSDHFQKFYEHYNQYSNNELDVSTAKTMYEQIYGEKPKKK